MKLGDGRLFHYGILSCYHAGISGQILKIFDATDEMLLMGIPAVRIMSTAFIFAGFSVTCSGMFQAVGKGVYSMIVSMARQLFVILPVAYFCQQ